LRRHWPFTEAGTSGNEITSHSREGLQELGFKFTSLYHLMNEELLRKDAAAGIDKMTKEMYAENLETNLVFTCKTKR